MFRIGDFSRLSRVSIRALRLYDQMGLLKPSYVDPFTAYRYYSAEQLPCLNRIVAFKDLGFSLEQIAELLNDNVPPAQIRGMLRLRQSEVQQLIETEQARLTKIETRLQQIEQEHTATHDVILKQVEPQTVMGIRDRLPVCSQIQQLHVELNQYLQEQQIETAGFWQSLWYDSEFEHENVDAEAAVPICNESIRRFSKSLAAHERINQYSLPAAQMACVIHQGSYSTIVQAFNALLQWIEINHYQIAGANREVYLHPNLLNANFVADPTVDHAIIEIQFPVRENV